MSFCAKCKKYCGNYVLCSNCMKKLKEELMQETIVEFEKQYKSADIDSYPILKYAVWEIEHNYCYDNLTEQEFKNKVAEIFIEKYHYKLVGYKLYEIKTGKKKDINKINPDDLYWD